MTGLRSGDAFTGEGERSLLTDLDLLALLRLRYIFIISLLVNAAISCAQYKRNRLFVVFRNFILDKR